MNIVFIVPTGIGAEIGGHAGDANPAAKLIASCCDNLITHPNVVNASDINEMTENTLYVEGSMLDRFLGGEIQLKKVTQNKILIVVNPPLKNEVINAVSAARVTIGINVEIVVLNTPLTMEGWIDHDRAVGLIRNCGPLLDQIANYKFDVLAVNTRIDVERDVKLNYFRNGGVNPWGGVEAELSKILSNELDKPVAHSPTEDISPDDETLYNISSEIVDPRIAPEVLSFTYLHCILKGLHKAPRIGKGLSVDDIDCLISPVGCFSTPHEACIRKGIPIIAVKENRTYEGKAMPHPVIYAENYWEAAGLVMCINAGIDPRSVRRPLALIK